MEMIHATVPALLEYKSALHLFPHLICAYWRDLSFSGELVIDP